RAEQLPKRQRHVQALLPSGSVLKRRTAERNSPPRMGSRAVGPAVRRTQHIVDTTLALPSDPWLPRPLQCSVAQRSADVRSPRPLFTQLPSRIELREIIKRTATLAPNHVTRSQEVCLSSALLVETPTGKPTGFHALRLSPPVLTALDRAAYFEPTPIQAAVIPEALAGRDVIGQAQTGTGKTAAFLLPFLDSWRDKNQSWPEALVLAPTRELVAQVTEEAQKLTPSKHCR